ncbi:TPA: hypothetical protein QCV86_006205 [Bacillus thuringiensis]|nr:hypothetical protein [Bacillus thuringiensis]HDR6835739.1 hypothetical protein [Bacillus thuringiensis]HDR6861438.1 hypothetical protein [Bacillus thuringiensis]HDR6906207.1 hypothetical protein [Bacillus thuringiensis]HDR6912746.1 hypothetical protein [Bacillus thuringiensis]
MKKLLKFLLNNLMMAIAILCPIVLVCVATVKMNIDILTFRHNIITKPEQAQEIMRNFAVEKFTPFLILFCVIGLFYGLAKLCSVMEKNEIRNRKSN